MFSEKYRALVENAHRSKNEFPDLQIIIGKKAKTFTLWQN
jgi:hypothetical protein